MMCCVGTHDDRKSGAQRADHGSRGLKGKEKQQ